MQAFAQETGSSPWNRTSVPGSVAVFTTDMGSPAETASKSFTFFGVVSAISMDTTLATEFIGLALKDPQFRLQLADRITVELAGLLKDRIQPTPIHSGVFKTVSDDVAETEIAGYLDKMKDLDKNHVNLLDMVYDLDLPPDQISRIMDALMADGVEHRE
jgi:hypothetical protein